MKKQKPASKKKRLAAELTPEWKKSEAILDSFTWVWSPEASEEQRLNNKIQDLKSHELSLKTLRDFTIGYRAGSGVGSKLHGQHIKSLNYAIGKAYAEIADLQSQLRKLKDAAETKKPKK